MIYATDIRYDYVKEPFLPLPEEEPVVPDAVYGRRKENVLALMEEHGFDYVVFYADREHYSNFDYMVGFDPRFEEALLVLSSQGRAWLLLGNAVVTGCTATAAFPQKGSCSRRCLCRTSPGTNSFPWRNRSALLA